MVLMEYKIKMY